MVATTSSPASYQLEPGNRGQSAPGLVCPFPSMTPLLSYPATVSPLVTVSSLAQVKSTTEWSQVAPNSSTSTVVGSELVGSGMVELLLAGTILVNSELGRAVLGDVGASIVACDVGSNGVVRGLMGIQVWLSQLILAVNLDGQTVKFLTSHTAGSTIPIIEADVRGIAVCWRSRDGMEQDELELTGHIGVCSTVVRGLEDLNVGELNEKSIGGKNMAVDSLVPSTGGNS